MFNKKMIGLMVFTSVMAMVSVASASTTEPREVRHLVKCHEGKFDATNAVSLLNSEITKQKVYGGSGLGCYPDQHCEDEMIFIQEPFQVSAPTFVNIGAETLICVTLNK